MIYRNPFKGGMDLRFFANAEFESTDGLPLIEQYPIIARNTLRLLTMGWTAKWIDLISTTTLDAIFITPNPDILKEMRLAFQQGFELLFTQLQHKKLTVEEHEQAHLFISNCLNLLPLTNLNRFESFKIPQWVDDNWVMVDYQVVPIELTEKWGLGHLLLQDEDRVFAYGLEPLSNKKAQSHLIFSGTTYPSGQGFVSQVNSNLRGFTTVGETLYLTGRARIRDWLLWQLRQTNKVHVTGVSLGGSLSLLLAIDQGDLVTRIDALNPAGLHEPWQGTNHLDKWDELATKPLVVIQQQDRDVVSIFGVWKKAWQILQVKPPADKQGPNGFIDHIMNYAAFAETLFTPVDPELDNKNHKVRNFWLYTLGRSLIYYPLLLPFNYLVRPLFYTMWENKAYTMLALVSIATLTTLTVVGSLSLWATAGIVSAAALLASLVYCCKPEITPENTNDCAKIHEPQVPRNPSMDIYKNTMDIELTYQEVNSYYKTMRCLVKEKKEFLPEATGPQKMISGFNKRELLQASENPDNAEQVVTLTVTKAKAKHMERTLFCIKQLGHDNVEALKPTIETNYAEYRAGKLR